MRPRPEKEGMEWLTITRSSNDHDFAMVACNVLERPLGQTYRRAARQFANRGKNPRGAAPGKLGGAEGGKARQHNGKIRSHSRYPHRF